MNNSTTDKALPPDHATLIAIACLIYQEVFWELYPQEPWETMYTWTTVVANLALSIGMAWYALLGVAAYACLRDANELIAETFE